VFKNLLGFGKQQGPTPPKNQIEVVCPACGAAQYEPRLVVSTFCKECGVHLRIEKRKVIASDVSKAGGKPALPRSERNDSTIPLPSPAAKTDTHQPPVKAPAALDVSETGELGLGMMLQALGSPPQSNGEHTAPKSAPMSEERGIAPDFVEISTEPIQPSPNHRRPSGPLQQDPPTTGLQRMKDQGMFRQQYFKEAQCFDCSHKFKVGRSSRSASCPQCGAYISMEDVDLNMPSTQSIKTRGDVIIRKRGQLEAAELHCRELRCFGTITAEIHCLGDAIFRTVGQIVGEVRCRRFVVEKGSEITFLNSIHADEVEVHASITGNVFSKGQVLISSHGAINGDVTGRSVSIEPGGELNGAMNIVRASPSVPLNPPPAS
jgi:cytoskeletal protein CcmA (bactofilin family)